MLYLQGPTINILSQERNNYDRWSQKDSRTIITRHSPVMTGLQSLSEKATGSRGRERERKSVELHDCVCVRDGDEFRGRRIKLRLTDIVDCRVQTKPEPLSLPDRTYLLLITD